MRAPDSQSREQVRGERDRPIVSSARSLQSRTSSIMACGLMLLLGGGLLTWYYTETLSRQSHVKVDAQAATSRKAQSEMPLPPLDIFNALKTTSTELSTLNSPGAAQVPVPPAFPNPSASLVVSETPPLPLSSSGFNWPPLSPAEQSRSASSRISRKSAGKLAEDRQLAGASFARESVFRAGGVDASGGLVGGAISPDAGSSGGEIASLLRPTSTASARARVLPTRRFLLPKGAFIDCTLETAIDSTLPGMTTCVTATDTFSADGTVVLLERGTKLIGETRGQVQQGVARVFVLWTEARTPAGIVVPLESPGTDELGRSGLSGQVNRHFWDRFGAAILISTLDGAVQAAVQSSGRSSGPVIYNPSGAESVMTDVLKSTVNIPPTINKPNGDRIQVFVARDVDFRSVYELRPADTAR